MVRFKVGDASKEKYSDYELARAMTEALYCAFSVLGSVGSPFTRKFTELELADGKVALPGDFSAIVGLYADDSCEEELSYEIRGGDIYPSGVDATTVYLLYEYTPQPLSEPAGTISMPASMTQPIVEMTFAALKNNYSYMRSIADKDILRLANGAFAGIPDTKGIL